MFSKVISHLRVAVLASTIFLCSVVAIGPIMVASLFPNSKGIIYTMTRWWSWIVAKSMGVTFSISGVERVDPNRSYIVCPNHQSNADILALLVKLPVRFVWVIKKELLRIPIFGWGLGRTGAISLDRSKGKEALQRMRESSGVLNEGWSVLVYPEGTRTFDGKVQSFKRGAFVMAVHTGTPILPVSVNGAYRIMPRGTVHFRPGHMKLVLNDPIETQGMNEDDIPMLMEKTRQAIESNFDFDYDPFDGSGRD